MELQTMQQVNIRFGSHSFSSDFENLFAFAGEAAGNRLCIPVSL